MSTRPENHQDRRVPGLDTLRALGVCAVVAYHLAVPGVRGGFLGVTLFFVLSGYLITRLLLDEIQTRGTMNLVGFWRRRARRLIPAAYAVVLVCLGISLVAAPEMLQKLRGDGLAALLYVSNWWTIFHKLPYFESFGLPSPLAHLWTLAIEEQFYVFWPLVLVGLLVALRRRRRILVAVAAMVVGSELMMALTYDATDPNRSYLGTDTRVGEILIGALLALALHLAVDRQAVTKPTLLTRLGTRPRAWLLLVAAAAVWGTLAVRLSDQAWFAYHGGILLAALASAAMILALQAAPIAPFAKWLDAGLVGGIGRRSYSIYLWHFPVLVALSTATNIGVFSPTRSAVVLIATLACAEASYRFVERPIRVHGFRTSARNGFRSIRNLSLVPRTAAVAIVAVPVVVPVLAMAGVNMPEPTDHGPTTVVIGAKPADTTMPTSTPTAPETPAQQPQPSTPAVGADTVAVGDSLMIDISRQLARLFPGITINAEVGRQPWTGLDIARSYKQFNRPGGTYILGIGTNGAIDARKLTAFCQSRASARVLLITPRVNRPWEGTSVDAIRRAAKACPNVRVVDFHRASAGHPEYFGPDGVHLTGAGTRAMVQLIKAASR